MKLEEVPIVGHLIKLVPHMVRKLNCLVQIFLYSLKNPPSRTLKVRDYQRRYTKLSLFYLRYVIVF